jgi:hypothetical protein
VTISGESDASAPHPTPAIIVAARLAEAFTGRAAAAVIEPPESKFKMFE